MEQTFSKELLKLLKKQIPLREKLLMPILNRITITNIDGKYKYNDLPESQMRLYCAVQNYTRYFFDTKKELYDFMKSSDIRTDSIYAIDYIGEANGRDRVIKVTYTNGHEMLYNKVDEYGWNGHAIYDPHKSNSTSKYIWEYHLSSIDDIYNAFIDRGINVNQSKLQLIK